MNRKSLFDRLAAPSTSNRPAVRQEYFRVHLEPLEDRKLLTATVIFSNTWQDLAPGANSTQTYSSSDNLFDPISGQTVTGGASSGTAFGSIAWTNPSGAVVASQPLHLGVANPPAYSANDLSNLQAAIQGAGTNGTVTLEPSYTNVNTATTSGLAVLQINESDVVISQTGVTLTGDGNYAATQYVIAPEVASTRGEANFPVGSHQGIIVNAPQVTIKNLDVDGSASTVSGVGGYNFHQGITTMYDLSGGGNYTPQHAGKYDVPATIAPNNFGGNAFGAAGAATITINGVTVQNTFYKGITMSDVTGQSMQRIDVQNNNLVNIGTTTDTGGGTPTSAEYNNRTAILLQNIDSGEIRNNTVTNAGVGIASGVFGSITGASLGSFSDLVVDPTNNQKFTSASHTFVAADIGTQLLVTGGGGFTKQLVTITSVSGGAALTAFKVGNTGSTGGSATWTMAPTVQFNTDNYRGVTVGSTTTGGTGVGWSTARNKTGMALNVVQDAKTMGYNVTYQDGTANTNILTNWGSYFDEGFVANTATFTVASNTAIGVYMNYSQPFALGSIIKGASIGLEVQNTVLSANRPGGGTDSAILPAISGISISGPALPFGAGSIGILENNSAAFPIAPYLFVTGNSKVTGTGIGVLTYQAVAPTGGASNTLILGSVILTGNYSDDIINGINPFGGFYANPIGAAQVIGDINGPNQPTGSPELHVASVISPIFANAIGYLANGSVDSLGQTAVALTPTDASVINTGNLTLGTSNVFSALLTNQTGSHDLFNFNSPLNDPRGNGNSYKIGAIPGPPSAGITQDPDGTTGNFSVTQDGTDQGTGAGSGVIVLSGNNGTGGAPAISYVQNTSASSLSGTTYLFTLAPTDIHDASQLNFSMKLFSDNQTPSFLVGLVDIHNDFEFWEVPASILNSSTFTTVSINLLSLGLPISGLGTGKYLDLTQITGLTVDADFGLTARGATTGAGLNLNLHLALDDVSVSGIRNSQFNVTGTVTLDPLANPSSNPTLFTATANNAPVQGGTTPYTIINNDGTDAISGIFLALGSDLGGSTGLISPSTSGTPLTSAFGPAGTVDLQLNGNYPGSWYHLSYTGGDGNDVTLTQEGVYTDLNGLVVNGTGFSSTWNNTGAVSIDDPAAAAIVNTDGGNITSLTAAFAASHAGDTLTATASGLISVTFSGGTLTLSGADSVANYQTVLRTIMYNNTLNSPNVSSETINVTAFEGVQVKNTAVATVNVSVPIVNLGAGTGNYSSANWTNAGPIAAVNSTSATITDAESATLTQLTMTFAVSHAGDTLTATPVGSVGVSFAGGALTLSGTDTLANYQAVLRSVQYDNFMGGPGVSTDLINVVATDGTHPSATVTSTINVVVVSNSSVVGRDLFYDNTRNQAYDDGAGVDAPNGNPNNQNDDDLAIDTSKTAYLPGVNEFSTQAQAITHLSSYALGLNGVMIDLSGTHGTITASDLVFKTGDDNAGFAVVPTSSLPTQVSVRVGAGVGGSDRIEIVWGATTNTNSTTVPSPIINTWLEVELKANANTNLAVGSGPGWDAGIGDRFFFANLVGDASDTGSGAYVTNAADEVTVRNGAQGATVITNQNDFDRNGAVNANDQIITRHARIISLDWIDQVSGMPFAPTASTGGAVASALAASSGSSGWVTGRLASMGDLNTGSAASYFQSLASSGTSEAVATLEAADAEADNLGLDDELLDSLLADLGAE